MATISSHILDSLNGLSASGIRVELFRLDGEARTRLFDVSAGDEGRIVEAVDIGDAVSSREYELIFHGGDYFARCHGLNSDAQRVVVLRFTMPEADKRYHMPIMLSPHSYSVWWSS
ncbi:MAG: 5-hydroxyisourate hydrolase [Planctomycetota bacterium]|jgi:5-hydroxyisourate hydrolase